MLDLNDEEVLKEFKLPFKLHKINLAQLDDINPKKLSKDLLLVQQLNQVHKGDLRIIESILRAHFECCERGVDSPLKDPIVTQTKYSTRAPVDLQRAKLKPHKENLDYLKYIWTTYSGTWKNSINIFVILIALRIISWITRLPLI